MVIHSEQRKNTVGKVMKHPQSQKKTLVLDSPSTRSPRSSKKIEANTNIEGKNRNNPTKCFYLVVYGLNIT